MPELPEVETLRRQIAPCITGRKIKDVHVATHHRFAEARAAASRIVRSVDRRGKYLVLRLSGASDLVLHLGMTGQLLWREEATIPGEHTHLGLEFSSGFLWFRDPRRFGRAAFVPSGEYSGLPTLANLGPEPDDPSFTVARTCDHLRPAGAPVKARLLEQRLVAGVGNYLADETLWRARVHPERRSLTTAECRRIHRELIRTVQDSIAAGGVSERDYVHLDGSRGGYAAQLAAHGRAGMPCRRCRTTLRHGRVAGRGTVWCPVCQPPG